MTKLSLLRKMYTPKKEIYKNLLGYITGYNMKKFLCVAMIATISTASFAYTEQLSSSELKSMDCATLAVEKSVVFQKVC